MNQDRIDFKAYRTGRLVLHVWAIKGTAAEIAEISAFQARLDCGELSKVEVIERGKAMSMLTASKCR